MESAPVQASHDILYGSITSAALHGATPEQLIRLWYACVWNQWDTSVLPEVLATDITFRGSLGDVVVGHAG